MVAAKVLPPANRTDQFDGQFFTGFDVQHSATSYLHKEIALARASWGAHDKAPDGV